MSKKINLYWFKFNEGHGNFGDELNHYIVSKLSGREINHVIIPSTGYDYIRESLRLVYQKAVIFKDYPKLITQFFLNDFIVGIGSVIRIPNSSKARIWGSGIIKADEKINEGQFYAVRGRYTQKRLRELGYTAPDTIGDPALLLPLVFTSKSTKKYKIGIIPHHIHYESVKDKTINESIKIINLLDPIEQIVDEINSCEMSISTSLHGIIVSQAYGIPSLWYTYADKSLYGDNIKFYDYFSSVGIEKYKPFNLLPSEIKVDEVLELFKNYEKVTKINTSLKEIQEKLISAAPFDVLEKYKYPSNY